MIRSIPPEPDLEPAATYSARLADWWRLSDVALRANQAARCEAWTAQIVPVMAPTLDRIADAWDALDARLAALADALRPASPVAPLHQAAPDRVPGSSPTPAAAPAMNN